MTSSLADAVHRAPTAWPREATAATKPAGLFHAGDVLNDLYEIRGKLGEGGMGEVYEAYDRSLGRRVAIKAARPDVPVPILGEARALAALRHPGIVAVHGVGEHAGVPYVVMERVPGKTLEAHLQGRRADGTWVTLEEAIDILILVAEALAAVHQAGMAHCDVKPANVILSTGSRVVLTDFGIFRPEIELGAAEVRAGSPHYMAPEAIADDVRPGDRYLVDVYALGVVAHELVAGAIRSTTPRS